jgi:hypothetical protein
MKENKKVPSDAFAKFGFIFLLALPIFVLVQIFKITSKKHQRFELNDIDESNNDIYDSKGIEETKTYTNTEVDDLVHKGNISDLTPRQRRIFAFIEKNKSIEMAKLQKQFKSVTVRTLRRDLKVISDKNLITKVGNTKGVIYKLS